MSFVRFSSTVLLGSSKGKVQKGRAGLWQTMKKCDLSKPHVIKKMSLCFHVSFLCKCNIKDTVYRQRHHFGLVL